MGTKLYLISSAFLLIFLFACADQNDQIFNLNTETDTNEQYRLLCYEVEAQSINQSSLSKISTGDIEGRYTITSPLGRLTSCYTPTPSPSEQDSLIVEFGENFVEETSDAIAMDSNSNIYLAGQISPDGQFEAETQIFVRKFDTDGNEKWLKTLGSSNYENVRDIVVDGDDFIYIVGKTAGKFGEFYYGFEDAYVTKLDGDGNTVWTKQFGTQEYDSAIAVTVDNSNHVYVAIRSNGDLDFNNNLGYSDAYVMKLNSDGIRIWTRQIASTSSDSIYKIKAEDSGFIYLTGETNGNLGEKDCNGTFHSFLAKLDASGFIYPVKEDCALSLLGIDIDFDGAGNLYLLGLESTYFVKKYDYMGSDVFTVTTGLKVDQFENGKASLDVDDNGKFYVAGTEYDSNITIVEFNSDGYNTEKRTIQNGCRAYASDMIKSGDEIYVTGKATGFTSNGTCEDIPDSYDGFLMKLF